MIPETAVYSEKQCDVCESRMKFVYEPVTKDFTGYVCLRPDCENHYTELVY
jgi:hypothetical protein